LNRQFRRATQKQEAQRRAQPRPQPKPPGAPGSRARTGPRQFLKEVVAELRKVAWPNREEVTAYTLVVLVSVIVIAAVIWVLDWVFSKAVVALYGIH
jgi:preprotein translocase subunit SecE